MKEPAQPLFLERQSYLRRRLIDAARVLPIFGLFLFMLPLLWPSPEADTTPFIAQKGLYIFAVWLVLVICAAVLAYRIRPEDPAPREGKAQEKT